MVFLLLNLTNRLRCGEAAYQCRRHKSASPEHPYPPDAITAPGVLGFAPAARSGFGEKADIWISDSAEKRAGVGNLRSPPRQARAVLKERLGRASWQR